jgi:hypothetical protein
MLRPKGDVRSGSGLRLIEALLEHLRRRIVTSLLSSFQWGTM